MRPPGCLLTPPTPGVLGGQKGGGEGCWSVNGVKGTEARPLPCQVGGQVGLVD